MTELFLTGLLLLGGVAPGDTTLTLERGDRLEVEQLSGEVIVRAWERSELSVRGEDDDGAAVVVERSGRRVRVVPDDRKGRRRSRNITLWVPEWIDVQVRGRSLDVTVVGVGGTLDVNTVDGDVSVSETTGSVSLRSVEGEISVRDARGRILARSQSDDIRLEDIVGSVEVESGSGDIRLVNVDAESVRAETLDGDVEFDGVLHSGGTYEFYVHDGDVVLSLPSTVGAQVSVATFDGEFTSEFPVRVERFSGGRAFDFMLGDGGARLEVEVFDGEIRLLRRR